MKSQLIAVGGLTTAVMNLGKCRGPHQALRIIGHFYDALAQTVKLPPCKQQKYLAKLRTVLSTLLVRSKELESLLGYLGWASWTEPYGRPFLSALVVHINRKNPRALVSLGDFAVLALKIWEIILRRNAGCPYDYILDRLPYAEEEIFVDASTS